MTDTFKYDEFGGITFEAHINSIALTSFRYANEYYDTETGNYYLRSRYYDPSIGRFTQPDTFAGSITDPLSLNLYTYCHNNPINFIDPSGHEPREMTIGDSTYYYDTDDFTSSQQDYEFSFVIGAAQRGELDMGGFLSGARDFGIGMKTDIYMDLDETTFLKVTVSSTMTAEQFDRAISAMSEYEAGYLNQSGLRYYLTANAVEICEVYASKAGISVRLRYIASLHGGTVTWCQNEYGENNASRQILPGVAAVTIGNKTARYYVGDGRGTNNVNDSLYVDKDVFYKDFDGAYGNGYGPKDAGLVWKKDETGEYAAYIEFNENDKCITDQGTTKYSGSYKVKTSALIPQENGYAAYYTIFAESRDNIIFEVYNGKRSYAKLPVIEQILAGYEEEAASNADMSMAYNRAVEKVNGLGLSGAIKKLYLTMGVGVEYRYSQSGKFIAMVGYASQFAAITAYSEYSLNLSTSKSQLRSLGSKQYSYVQKRGWTWDAMNDVVDNPYTTREAVNKANNNPATAYYNAAGDYVVVDNITHELVQVSKFGDTEWIPDSTIKNPYLVR